MIKGNIKKYQKEILATIGIWIIAIVLLNLDALSINWAVFITILIAMFGYILKMSNDIAQLKVKTNIVYDYVVDKINDVRGDNE